MLSVFPEILFLSPLAPTLLRLSSGVIFLMIAWKHYEEREAIGATEFSVIGRGIWIPLFAAVIELGVSLALIIGMYTQAVAILGALLALKHFIWNRAYPQLFPLSRISSALLFVICLSLIVTGAGAFAFDLPL